MPVNSRLKILGLAVVSSLALSLAAPAQEPPQSALDDNSPQATTASYRDWTLRCDHLPETPPRQVCEVVQAVRAPEGQAVLAQIVIGRPGPDQPNKLIVQLPAGVWLPADAILAVPSGERVPASFTQCMQICVADADLDEATIAALKAATEPATLLFQDGNRRPVELPISLNGFTAAITQAQQ